MTRAQEDAHVCGVVPHEHDPRFVAQHLAAYAFIKPQVAGKRILEIGFGSGYGADYLADVAKDVLAVDLAPGNIPRAEAAYQRPNLRFCHMDATRLSLPSDSMDVVYSFQVIEHIPEPLLLAYVSEISRVMRPEGFACLSTLNLAHNRKPGRPYEKLIYHEKEFTAEELETVLTRAFPVVTMHGLHPTRRHRVMQRLKKWGFDKLKPSRLNPIARFYRQVSVEDFTVSRDVSRAALDLLAVCRKVPASSSSPRLDSSYSGAQQKAGERPEPFRFRHSAPTLMVGASESNL